MAWADAFQGFKANKKAENDGEIPRLPLFDCPKTFGCFGGPKPSKYNPNPATCAADSGLAVQGFLTAFPAREAQRAERETAQYTRIGA